MGPLKDNIGGSQVKVVGEQSYEATDPTLDTDQVVRPSGLDDSTGIYSTAFLKAADDPQWADDDEVKRVRRPDEEVRFQG